MANARIEVQTIPIMANGAVVGIAAGVPGSAFVQHRFDVDPTSAFPLVSWSPDGMGGTVGTRGNLMVWLSPRNGSAWDVAVSHAGTQNTIAMTSKPDDGSAVAWLRFGFPELSA